MIRRQQMKIYNHQDTTLYIQLEQISSDNGTFLRAFSARTTRVLKYRTVLYLSENCCNSV